MNKFLLGLAILVLTASPLLAEAPKSLCTSDEIVIFTCPATGKEMISVCAPAKYGPETGYLQYRFGTAEQPEISPKEKTPPAKVARNGMWTFAGGGGAYLQIIDGEASYYVYSAFGNWGPNGEDQEKAGVLVKSGGDILNEIKCQAPATNELGPAFFDEAGIPQVEEEIDLPE